ncbi:MAG: electron transporter RnfC, partial [Fibrobacteres bacterium]|nr:electron transporter RnfC [Fibrobacterota bacterium]
MRKFRFRGGVHPPENKVTASLQSERAPLPPQVVINFSQNIGAPAIPIVKAGDTVQTGQKIADKGGFVSVPLHSSITGTVKSVTRHTDSQGRLSKAVIIERAQDESVLSLKPVENPISAPNQVLVDA